MKYVIVGNSTAAIGAVEGIRTIDKMGEIILISNESYHTYSRPLISYFLLGKVTEGQMKYRDNDFYLKNNVTLILGVNVISIEAENKNVKLDNGNIIFYDKLLVATGSSPLIPPIKGLDKVKNKFTFATLDDAKEIDKSINENSKVLILGAGLIGLKCAEGISIKSMCVDLSPKVLSSILDDESSKMLKAHLENHNIKFYLEKQIVELHEKEAVLSDNTRISFDVLVLAVGVRPNISLIKDIGGKTNRGICIDEKSRTTITDIYAAGDCCESMDISSSETKVMALLPNAYMQGECAGINMAGDEKEFSKAIPMNAIGFFGLHIITAGSYIGDVYSEYRISEDDSILGEETFPSYKKLFYSNNKLNGYILIGNVEKAGIYTNLIREQTPLDSIDFSLICKKPSLMAFSKVDRNVVLGGVGK